MNVTQLATEKLGRLKYFSYGPALMTLSMLWGGGYVSAAFVQMILSSLTTRRPSPL
jgi:hypothetical protein